jgi:ketosteroid isomerase-like protein
MSTSTHQTPAHAGTTTRPTAATQRREVQEILDQIAVAITAGDGDAVAPLFETPAFIVGPTMAMTLDSDEATAKMFSAGKAQYTKMGITDTRAEILALEWIGEGDAAGNCAVAQVRWPYLDERGREIGGERSDYTFKRDDDGTLKVRAILMRGVEGGKQ